MAALCLAIATTLAAGGTLALASVLYAPIEKATTLSACERGSLTFAQEQVSTVVVNLKFLVIMGSPVAGLLTLTIAIIAIALDRGRRLGQVAILILVAAAIDGFAMLLFAFPMDPVRWHMTCGGG